jgi:hypothetical protein
MTRHMMIHPASALRDAVLICWSVAALAAEPDDAAVVAPEGAFSITLDAV